jgi:hypothetical protein
MRKTMAAMVLLLAAQSGWAGVSYEFVQSSQSDIEQIPATNLTGRAIIDGERSRVDFVSGNIYAPGAYVLSTDGNKTMLYVDPVSKTFSEVNAAAIAASYGAANMRIANFKAATTKLEDHPIIAGVPTEHYHLAISYDLTLPYGTMFLTQNVREEIDKWTTVQFGDISETFLAGGGIRTGNPQLDQVIEAETTTIKGFPLRQSVVVSTTNPRGTAPGSELKLSNVRRQQRDLVVTAIHTMNPIAAAFTIPSTFQKMDGSQQQQKLAKPSQVTILSFEPGTK